MSKTQIKWHYHKINQYCIESNYYYFIEKWKMCTTFIIKWHYHNIYYSLSSFIIILTTRLNQEHTFIIVSHHHIIFHTIFQHYSFSFMPHSRLTHHHHQIYCPNFFSRRSKIHKVTKMDFVLVNHVTQKKRIFKKKEDTNGQILIPLYNAILMLFKRLYCCLMLGIIT